MRLDCAGFEVRLEAWLARRLSRAELAAVAEHVARCAGCRELLELAEAAPGEVDLAAEVLGRTSGPACGRARELLGESRLAAIDAALVEGHLAGCTDCARLAGAIAELRRDLPLLASVDPGERFTQQVLDRTRALARPRPVSLPLPLALPERWAVAWQRLVFRPRFALEAAYVLTLLVWAVLGVPTDLLAGISRVREVPPLAMPVSLEGTIRETGTRLRAGAEGAWRETGAPLALEARRSLEQAAAYSGDRFEELQAVLGTLWARVASEPAESRQAQPSGEPDHGDQP